MDIIKKNNKKTISKNYLIIMVIGVLLLAWYLLSLNSHISVDRKDILVKTVKQGTLNNQVEGYGKLRSAKQTLLTSQSNATVKTILLKPGALVTRDSIILELKNPELEYEVKVAEQDFQRELANLRKLKLTQVREMLTTEEKLELIKSEYETASMRQKAMSELVEKGIVSRLDYNSVVLQTRQLEKRIGIIEQSVTKLQQVHLESVNIQLEAIDSARSNFDTVQKRFEQLMVKAGMDGILQRLPVELGQSLVVGQQMALIGGTEDLLALIKVPQAEAVKIQAGQKASIDTRKEVIEATVQRVSPTVEDGSVEIEIALTGTLPTQLRPEQNVDATVFIDQIDRAYFIQRPGNAQPFSTTTMYRLSEDQSMAVAVTVEFGVASGRLIEIISGVSVGDSLVISDISNLDGIPEFRLTN